MKALLIEVANSVGLADDVEMLGALGRLAAEWASLSRELPDFASALELARAIADGATNQAVVDAFEKVGAREVLEKLQGAAAKLKVQLDQLPDEVGRLLQPIGAFDEQATGKRDSGVVRWTILDRDSAVATDGGADAAKPAYSLSVGARAGLTIEAGDTWPYSDPMPAPLLRLRADGELKSRAAATLPFNVGQARADAESGAACALEYFFAVADPATVYAAAVGKRLAALPDPFDFDSLWNAFATTDLAAVHYEFDGSARLNVAVSLADVAGLGGGVEASLGATVGVGVSLSGKYFLTMRSGPLGADGTPRMIAALSRQRGRGAAVTTQIGVTVDLASLAGRVHELLKSALERSDKALAKLTPYLSPATLLHEQGGNLIRAQAERLVGDQALREALVRDLQGVIGIDRPDEPALADWLSGQLSAALDIAHGWAEAQSGAALDLVANLGRALPAFGQTELRPILEASADELVKGARAALEDKIAGLSDDVRKELVDVLERIGLSIDKGVAKADRPLARVRALIARYQSKFRKIVDAAGEAARAKASVAIQIEESRLDSAALEIEGTFAARSDSARSAFRALTLGDFDSLVPLFEGGGGDFVLDPERSSLRRFASRSGKLGIEVVLFGFGATGSELLSAEAEVLVDGNGQVQVDARSRLEKRFKGLDAEREITLVSAYSLVMARKLANAAPSVERALGLSVTMGHVDDRLKRKELERFVGSLVDARLLAPSALTLATETFDRWIGNPGSNDRVPAALSVKLALDRESLAKLLELGSASASPTLSDARSRHIIISSFDALRLRDSADRHAIDSTLAFLLQEKFRGKLRDDVIMDRKRVRNALEDVVTGSHIRRISVEDRPFVDAVDLGFGMRDMIQRLRQIYFSTPQTARGQDPDTWTAEDYRDAERAAAKAVRDWLQLNNILFWTDSKVHPRVIAFIETLLDLAERDPLESLSLTISRTGDVPETVVLTRSS